MKFNDVVNEVQEDGYPELIDFVETEKKYVISGRDKMIITISDEAGMGDYGKDIFVKISSDNRGVSAYYLKIDEIDNFIKAFEDLKKNVIDANSKFTNARTKYWKEKDKK